MGGVAMGRGEENRSRASWVDGAAVSVLWGKRQMLTSKIAHRKRHDKGLHLCKGKHMLLEGNFAKRFWPEATRPVAFRNIWKQIYSIVYFIGGFLRRS